MTEIIIPVGARTHLTDSGGYYRDPSVYGYGQYGYGQSGGVFNKGSGLGGAGDKSEGTSFSPTVLENPYPLRVMYVESWAAKKFIDMPIDDMFMMGQEYKVDDDEVVKEMERSDTHYMATESMIMAAKAARLYGTAFLVFITDDDLSQPADFEKIKSGALKSILVFDRFDCSVEEYYSNPLHPKFNKPSIYRFTPESQYGEAIEIVIHESRCIRFDGMKALSSNGWQSPYVFDWGISELLSAIVEITHDSAFMQAITHLSQEASIPVIKVQGLDEALSGTQTVDTPTMAEIATSINMGKSVWKTMFLDTQNEFQRVQVSFAGMADLLDRFAVRLAAIAGVPVTRFMGRSPAGMNSTGDGDMANYSAHVSAMQNRMIKEPSRIMNTILALNAGITEVPESEFRPLMDISESDKATIAKTNAESVMLVANGGVIDENEAREMLSKIELFGKLPKWDENKLAEMHGPDPIEEMAAKAELENQGKEQEFERTKELEKGKEKEKPAEKPKPKTEKK